MSDPGRPPRAPPRDYLAEFLEGLTEAQREQFQQIPDQQLQRNTEEERVQGLDEANQHALLQRLVEQIPRLPPSLDGLTTEERLRLGLGTYFLTMEEILHNGNKKNHHQETRDIFY